MLIEVFIDLYIRVTRLRPLFFICQIIFQYFDRVFFLISLAKLDLNLQFSLLQNLRSQINRVIKSRFFRIGKISQYFEYILQLLVDRVIFVLDTLLPMEIGNLTNGDLFTRTDEFHCLGE